jgi:uncharacterized protein YegP (UPF0339 family)
MAYNFHTYVDSAKRWRLQLVAENGKIVADSGYSYEDLAAVRASAQRAKDNAATATID